MGTISPSTAAARNNCRKGAEARLFVMEVGVSFKLLAWSMVQP
jgi:hypothetical protein